MAKLAIATVVLVALFLAVAEVSSFRTIVTTTIEEVQQQQEEICRQRIQQKYQQLQSCWSYLKPSGSPFVLKMYGVKQQGQQEEQQEQCCQPLRELSDCGCHAIQQMVDEQVWRLPEGQEGQWGQGQQSQEQEQAQQQVYHILQKAREIPRVCGLQQECQIRTPSYY